MPRTTSRREPGEGAEIVKQSSDLATLGFQDLGIADKETVNLIFRTVAKECRNRDEQWLYLSKCKANGLSPLKGELFATRRSGELVFITAYSVFVSRARRAGYVIAGESVGMTDVFDGWDGVKLEPVRHIIKPEVEGIGRGDVIGAYAYATHVASGQRLTGGWWDWRELITDEKKIEAKDGFMWRKMTHHMSKRTAWLRVARMVAPDLSSLYGVEEMGYVHAESDDKEAQDVVGSVTTEPVEPDEIIAAGGDDGSPDGPA